MEAEIKITIKELLQHQSIIDKKLAIITQEVVEQLKQGRVFIRKAMEQVDAIPDDIHVDNYMDLNDLCLELDLLISGLNIRME